MLTTRCKHGNTGGRCSATQPSERARPESNDSPLGVVAPKSRFEKSVVVYFDVVFRSGASVVAEVCGEEDLLDVCERVCRSEGRCEYDVKDLAGSRHARTGRGWDHRLVCGISRIEPPGAAETRAMRVWA